jgi:UDP-glucose 4-epimerase
MVGRESPDLRDRSSLEIFRGRGVLITGGLGFIGSSLARRLTTLGARVTVLDSLDPRYGGNLYNVRDVADALEVIVGDVRDPTLWLTTLPKVAFVFHLAAQVSYIDSLAMPMEDLEVNTGSTLRLLHECSRLTSPPKLVYASSRMVLGRAADRGGSSGEQPRPLSLYGVHKYASELQLSIYHEAYAVPTLALRITNPYGPRQQMHHNKYSLVGWFVRQAMQGETIKIFGDGQQTRDYIFIDDIVEAFLRASASEASNGAVLSLGSGVATRFVDMARTVVRVIGAGALEFTPWPSDYERVETGDVVADITRLNELTDWKPVVGLSEGIERTFQYYLRHLSHYVR